jgi:hypothetical protein
MVNYRILGLRRVTQYGELQDTGLEECDPVW